MSEMFTETMQDFLGLEKLSDINIDEILNLDFPFFKCDKNKGSPGLALAWCLLNNKGITSITSMHRYKEKDVIPVILETAFSDYPVANRGTFRVAAFGYMKISDKIKVSNLPLEMKELKIDGIPDMIKAEKVGFSVKIYNDSSFCKAPKNSELDGAYYFDIYKNKECTENGWNINKDFVKTLYSFLQEDDNQLFENNQLFEEDNTITIGYNKTFKDEKEKLKERYKIFVKPIIQHLKENKIGIDEDVSTDGLKKDLKGAEDTQYAHNIILSGPPGVGKSYIVDESMIPTLISAQQKKSNIERITITPSTTYEDFFGCYKPQMNGNDIKYDFSEGVFCRILRKALDSPDDNFVLVVEELNRADVYDVFGQVFQLLDRRPDGRSSYEISMPKDAQTFFKDTEQLKNTYTNPKTNASEVDYELWIPNNMYIICTMNSADQGVHMLDTAFKRRFEMIYVDIDGIVYAPDNVPLDKTKVTTHNTSLVNLSCETYHKVRKEINEKLKADPKITDDKMISEYFLKTTNKRYVSSVEFIVKVLGMPCTNMSMLLLFYFVCAYIKVLRRGKYDRQYKLEFRNVLLAFVVFYIGFIILMGLQPFANFSQCEALKELRALDGVFNDFEQWLVSTLLSAVCFAIPLRIARSAMEFCFSNQAFVRNRKGKVVLNHDGLEQALHTGKQKAIQGTVYGNYTKTLEGIFALCSKVIAAL